MEKLRVKMDDVVHKQELTGFMRCSKILGGGEEDGRGHLKVMELRSKYALSLTFTQLTLFICFSTGP